MSARKPVVRMIRIERDSLSSDRIRAGAVIESVASDLLSCARMLENFPELESRDRRSPRGEPVFDKLVDDSNRLRLLAMQAMESAAKIIEMSGQLRHIADIYLRDQSHSRSDDEDES